MTEMFSSVIRKTSEAAMRSNLYAFLLGAFAEMSPGDKLDPAPYLEAICCALQDIAEGRNRRLIISVAPRHLKSLIASVLFPAFLLGRDPTRKIMVVSYGGDLARQHAETFRRLVESQFYRDLFPRTRFDPRANRYDHMKTTRGGGRMAVSLGGAMTGFGADFIILDDLIKAGDANYAVAREQVRTIFDQTIYSRLNDKRTGAIVSVSQRLHADDITAYLLEKETFDHLVLPSIAQVAVSIPLYYGRSFQLEIGDILNPSREPMDILNRIRDEIGTYAFHAQYLQEPRPGESEFLRIDDLHLVDTLPSLEVFARRVQSWDTAAKDSPTSDYSVGMTFGWHKQEERFYLLDVYRGRPDYSALKDRIIAMRKSWNADKVLVEDSAMGMTFLQDVRREVGKEGYIAVKATEGKLERFLPVTDWLKKGRLIIPTSLPWYDAFRRELLTFPKDTKNDQVDALTQFMHWEARRTKIWLDTDPVTGRRLRLHRRESRSSDNSAEL